MSSRNSSSHIMEERKHESEENVRVNGTNISKTLAGSENWNLDEQQQQELVEEEEEATALLNSNSTHRHKHSENADEGESQTQQQRGKGDGTLSKAQIQQFAVLSIINLNEAFQINVIWPFVPNQVEWFGFDVESVGKYVGILAAVFFLCQFLSSFVWGAVSDIVGRRPTLLMGLLGTGMAMVGYSLSQTYAQAVLFRSLGGLLNGNIGITKTYMGEVTDSSTQSRGFSLLAFNWGIGSIIAPVVGGYLSEPEANIPSLFGGNKFFKKFPYSLPCLASAGVAILGALLGYFLLPETPVFLNKQNYKGKKCQCSILNCSKRWKRSYHTLEEETVNDEETGTPVNPGSDDKSPSDTEDNYVDDVKPNDKFGNREEEFNGNVHGKWAQSLDTNPPQGYATTSTDESNQNSHWRVFRDRNVMFGIIAYALFALGAILFDELFSVFLQTPRKHQGLEMEERDVGTALTISGVGLVVYQLFVYPKLADRLGKRFMFLLGSGVCIPLFVLFPVMHFIPKWLVWPVLATWVIFKAQSLANGFTSIIMLINNAAKGENLGVVNGIAQSSSSLTRCIGPFLGGSIYSASLEWGSSPLRIFTAYVIMGIVMCICSGFGYALPPWTNYAPSEQKNNFREKR